MFATAPSTVTITTGSAQTFSVPAGVTKLAVQLTPGAGMSGTITRDSSTVVSVNADGYTFNANPSEYNFNAFVAYASS